MFFVCWWQHRMTKASPSDTSNFGYTLHSIMHNTVQYIVICIIRKYRCGDRDAVEWPSMWSFCAWYYSKITVFSSTVNQYSIVAPPNKKINQILFNISLALFFLSTSTSINIMQMLQFKVDKKERCLHISPAIQSKSFIFHTLTFHFL